VPSGVSANKETLKCNADRIAAKGSESIGKSCGEMASCRSRVEAIRMR
jgi:hypothetical protein